MGVIHSVEARCRVCTDGVKEMSIVTAVNMGDKGLLIVRCPDCMFSTTLYCSTDIVDEINANKEGE